MVIASIYNSCRASFQNMASRGVLPQVGKWIFGYPEKTRFVVRSLEEHQAIKAKVLSKKVGEILESRTSSQKGSTLK